MQLGFEPVYKSGQVHREFLDDVGLGNFNDDQQQYNGTKTTGHHVKKGQVEDINTAACPFSHGQSLAGVMNDPFVSIASLQYAAAAQASPSMGISMVLTGIPPGISLAAS